MPDPVQYQHLSTAIQEILAIQVERNKALSDLILADVRLNHEAQVEALAAIMDSSQKAHKATALKLILKITGASAPSPQLSAVANTSIDPLEGASQDELKSMLENLLSELNKDSLNE